MAAIVLLALALLALATSSAPAATAPTTVAVTVASATNLTDNCTNATAYDFGNVSVGTSNLTTTGAQVCSLSFGSSNDTAMLRAYQHDRTGTAMASLANNFTAQTASTAYHISAVSHAPGTPLTAFGAVRAGKMIYTTNGTTWTQAAATGTTNTLDDVAAANTNYAYAAGDDLALIRTSNGGPNWVSICTTACAGLPATEDLLAVEAMSQSTVIVGTSNGNILRSTDADQASPTWSVVGTYAGNGFQDFQKVNATDVYGSDDNGHLYKSVDGGATWVQLSAGTFSYKFEQLAVIRNAGTDYIYGCTRIGKMLKGTMAAGDVTPGGGAWSLVVTDPALTSTALHGIAATDKDTVWVDGDFGNVWKTVNATNASPTFTHQAVANATEFEKATMDAGGVGYIGSLSAQVIQTSNGGGAWTPRLPTGFTESLDLKGGVARSSTYAYAAGTMTSGTGTLERTTDGTNWSTVASGVATNLNAIDLADDDHGIAVGDAGLVTTSSAASTGTPGWTSHFTGIGDDLFAVGMVNTGTAWAVGSNGRILRTDDGGLTWTSQYTSAGLNLRTVVAVSRNVAFAAGDGGTILRTLDGGTTWTGLTSGTVNNIFGSGYVNDGNIVEFGTDNGRVLRSVNGLATPAATVTFASQNTGTAGDIRGMAVLGSKVTEVSTRTGQFRRTTDGGTTWNSDPTPTARALTGLVVLDVHTNWVFGVGNRIYKETPGPTISDWAGGSTTWSLGTGSSMFGVCLQKLGGSAIADAWAVDTFGTANLCQANDTDPWNAVPTTATKIAHTTAAGQTGSVDLVYGLRLSNNQAAASYYASVTYEVIAPWV